MLRIRNRGSVGVVALLALVLAGGDSRSEGGDEQLEQFLLNASVVESREIGSGITKPRKLKLALHGEVRAAAFKFVDIEKQGRVRFATARTELNFRDSYKFDVAAYRLDRLLGLRMVPVAVIREIDQQEGAVVEWISNAVNEQERVNQNLVPPDPRTLLHQRAIMKLFDALILNVDRNAANQLITVDDWKLHPIDHTRAFRSWKNLPDEFVANPVNLPRGLVPKLEALEKKELQQLLKGLVTGTQISALLKRRDKILKKIAEDREKYGDALVFQD